MSTTPVTALLEAFPSGAARVARKGGPAVPRGVLRRRFPGRQTPIGGPHGHPALPRPPRAFGPGRRAHGGPHRAPEEAHAGAAAPAAVREHAAPVAARPE